MNFRSHKFLVAIGVLASGLLVAGLMYRDVLALPFLQDDWGLLRSIIFGGSGKVLVDSWLPHWGEFFRPVGKSFFLLLYQLFGLHPTGYRVAGLLLHAINGTILFHLSYRLTSAYWKSASVAILYLASAGIHCDTISWSVGCYDLLGAFFFFGSILSYASGRRAFSGILYAAAALSKESVLLLPVVLFAGDLLGAFGERRTWDASLRSLRIHIVTLAIVGGYDATAVLSGGIAATDPSYQVGLSVAAIVHTAGTYLQWSAEFAAPWVNDALAPSIAVAVLFVLIAAAIVAWRTERREIVCFFLLWVLCGIIPPFAFPGHAFRYYLTYALPAMTLAVVSSLPVGIAKQRALAMLFAICVLAGSIYAGHKYIHTAAGLGIDAPTVRGSNNLFRKGAVVELAEAHLVRNYPMLPEHTQLVFDWMPTVAFGRAAGPEIWFADSTLQVFEIQDVRVDSTGVYPLRPISDPAPARLRHPLYLQFHGDSLRSSFLR